jgi:parallel beta-helix repeat protein
MRASVALAITAAAVVVWAQPAQANPPCGAAIAANLVLTGNLTCAGTAMVVVADNIVVDLNGFAVTGNGSGTGVVVPRSGVTVRNGTVRSFDTGILIDGTGEKPANDNVVVRVTVQNNKTGVDLFESSRSVITDSVLHNNFSIGAVLHVGSDRNRIIRTRVTASSVGVLIREGSGENSVVDNTISKNEKGVVLTDGSDDNLIYGNSVVGNTETGVKISGPGASDNVVRANRITNNGVGVHMCCGGILEHNQILGNTVVSNANTGILVVIDFAPNNVVADNVASDNGFGAPQDPRKPNQYDDGIHVEAVNNALVTIQRNTADQNADLGIEASGNIVDGGGNAAQLNGDPAQCLGVVC